MDGQTAEAAAFEELPQCTNGEVVEVAGWIEMKPIRPTPARLPAREVGKGDHDPSTRSQNTVALHECSPRVGQVFEHMPDDDLIKKIVGVAGLSEMFDDPDL